MSDRPTPTIQAALLDAGSGRRLDRFGDRIVDRPHPGTLLSPAAPARWRDADLRFDRGDGWTGLADPALPWPVGLGELTMELRATASGGVGLFPEQLANVPWLEAQLESARTQPASVLNLFAHTGLLTLVAARAGAAVAHVDAARSAVGWARRNAELSGLADAPIRWLVDDAAGFVDRDVRRGRRYDGILLDPPTYGHAGRRAWQLESDLPALLAGCAALAAPGAFLLLTAHAAEIDDDSLAAMVRRAWPVDRGELEVEPLELAAESGAQLWLGTAFRLRRRPLAAAGRAIAGPPAAPLPR